MGSIGIVKELELRNNLLKSRINNSKDKKMEPYRLLGKRLVHIGDFVSSHLSLFNYEQVQSFLMLYAHLDRLHNPFLSPEITQTDIDSIEELIKKQEALLLKTEGYSPMPKVRREDLENVREKLDKVKFFLDDCSIQYVMNSAQLSEFIDAADLEELYSQAINYITKSIDIVEKKLKDEELNGCIKELARAFDITCTLTRMLTSRSKNILNHYKSALENRIIVTSSFIDMPEAALK